MTSQGKIPWKDHKVSLLGMAKWDLWGLGAESWFVVASYAFAKMVPPLEDHFEKMLQ